VLREVVEGGSATLGAKGQERVLILEFRRAYQEFSSQTRSFAEAYRGAAARLQVQPVTDLVEVLIQGQSGGAPILAVLRDMSENVYARYEQDISTLIKKKDSTFTIATVLIMLGAAIVIGAPIFDTVLKALSGGNGTQ
jgi:ERCC4-type nuclease